MKPGPAARGSRFGPRQILVVVILGVGMFGAALMLFQAQVRAQRSLETLFQIRGTIAAQFTQSYVNDVFSREQRVAEADLAGATVSQSQFQNVLDTFGFDAGVLLDRRGRVLRVAPVRQDLLGRDITARYAHLRAAVSGHRAVSAVVPSAARGTPLVAFALPYQTRYGRRVLSGGFDASRTPLGAYLRNALPQFGTSAYIVDDAGKIVASKEEAQTGVQSLDRVNHDLQAATGRGSQGTYPNRGAGQYFVVRAVPGTPWRLVISVPQDSLYLPVSGATRWIPWGLYLLVVLGALYALWLLFTLARSRTRLSRLYVELDQVARLDGLTSVYNRRQLDEDLNREVAESLRYEQSCSFILLDLDHFKPINDMYGHQVGDAVLRETASFLLHAVRDTDRVYRYRGEEFAVIAPNTEDQGAEQLGERLRTGIETYAYSSGKAVTASFGVSLIPKHAKTAAEAVMDADRALYQAKVSGRNRVVVHAERQTDSTDATTLESSVR